MKPWLIITGSSGFVGRNLLPFLAKKYEIAALDLTPNAEVDDHENIRRFKVDLGDKLAIEEFFKANPRPIAGFINLAAYYSFSNKPSEHYERLLNGLGTLSREFCRLKTPTAVFIQASSMACLEPKPIGQLLDSNSPSHPRWKYPEFKKKSEDILRKELKVEHYVEFVIAGVYSDFCELVPLYHFLESHRRNNIQRWFFPGNANRGLTYVHIDDLVEAFGSQLKNTPSHRRLLIGEPAPTTNRQIAEIADIELYHFIIPKLIVPAWLAKLGAWLIALIVKKSFYQPWMIDFAEEHYAFDLKDTTKQLNWIPKNSLKNRLPVMLTNAKNHPEKWKIINKNRPWHDDDWPQLKHYFTT